MDDRILTIREPAARLKIGEKTSLAIAQIGELPRIKVRDQCRLRRADGDAWIGERLHSQQPDGERDG